MKKFLEMRGADGGPWKLICAMPALWVGLLYNTQAQKEALELISEWTVEEMTDLRNEVCPLICGVVQHTKCTLRIM